MTIEQHLNLDDDVLKTIPPWERPEIARLVKPEPQPIREAILNAANLAICGDRAQAYGPPLDNWTRISTLWNAYIMIREQSEKPGIAPFEVAIFNILTKISRLSHTPNHKDSWVDIAGYAACGAEVSGVE